METYPGTSFSAKEHVSRTIGTRAASSTSGFRIRIMQQRATPGLCMLSSSVAGNWSAVVLTVRSEGGIWIASVSLEAHCEATTDA
ncbi:hypothetical protein LTR91_027036, partial [Friedmanniomyces endolithicus]